MKAWVMATGLALIAGSAHAQNMFAPPPPPRQQQSMPSWGSTNPRDANMHPYGYRGMTGSDGSSAGFAMPRRDGGTDYMSQDGTWTGRSYGRR